MAMCVFVFEPDVAGWLLWVERTDPRPADEPTAMEPRSFAGRLSLVIRSHVSPLDDHSIDQLIDIGPPLGRG